MSQYNRQSQNLLSPHDMPHIPGHRTKPKASSSVDSASVNGTVNMDYNLKHDFKYTTTAPKKQPTSTCFPIDNGLRKSLGEAPVRNLKENRPASNGTYIVRSPINRTQPIFVDQLIRQKKHSTLGSHKRGSRSTNSTQSSKDARQSLENGSSSISGVSNAHWINSGSASTDKTTSESLNSRRGCHKTVDNHARWLYG